MKERTLILNGLSKSHAMTGWRIGYAMGDPALVGAMTPDPSIHHALCPHHGSGGSPRSHAIGQDEMLHIRAAEPLTCAGTFSSQD